MEGENGIETLTRRQEKKFRIIFLYHLFAFPASSYLTSLVGIESNVISIAVRVIAVLLSCSYFIFMIRYRLFKIVSWSFWLFILFWVMYIPRIIYDTYFFGGLLGNPPSMYYFFGIVLGFILAIPLFSPVLLDAGKFEKACFAIVVVLNVIGLYNTLHSDFLFTERGSGNEKLNPITTGFIAALLVVFSLRRIVFKTYSSLFGFAGYVGCIVLGLAIMVITSTKSVFIFVVLAIMLFSTRLIRKRQYGAIFSILLIIVSIVLVIIFSGMGGYFELLFFRFQFTSTGDDRSSEERIQLLDGALRQIAESPFIGSFLEEKTVRQYPHNVIIEAFMALGILGGPVYCLLYFKYLVNTLQLLVQTDFSFFFLISFGFIILSIVSGSLSFGPELWYLIAATSGYGYLKKQRIYLGSLSKA